MSGGLQLVRALLALLMGTVIGGTGLSLLTRRVIRPDMDSAMTYPLFLVSVPSGALLGAVTGLAVSVAFPHRWAAGWVCLIGGWLLLAINIAVFLRWGSWNRGNWMQAFCIFHGLSALWAILLAACGRFILSR